MLPRAPRKSSSLQKTMAKNGKTSIPPYISSLPLPYSKSWITAWRCNKRTARDPLFTSWEDGAYDETNKDKRIRRKWQIGEYVVEFLLLLRILELDPLELIFLKSGLILIFKILRNRNHLLHYVLPPLLHSSSRNSRYKFQISLRRSKLKASLFPDQSVSLWNQLPLSILSAPSLALFRRSLDSFDFKPFLKGHALKALS